MEAQEKVLITDKQRRMIFGLIRQAGLDNDDLHSMIDNLYGLDSLKKLTIHQAGFVIEHLKVCITGVSKNVRGRATKAQQEYVMGMFQELGWTETPTSITTFLESKFKVSSINFLPEEKVHHLINALRSMVNRHRKKRQAVQD